jgi:hypothetical protein
MAIGLSNFKTWRDAMLSFFEDISWMNASIAALLVA